MASVSSDAAGVDDDDLVGPGGAVDGVGDMCGFVERDDGDRDTRHGVMLSQGRLLHGLQVDDGTVEVQDVLQLHVPRLREIALGLEHEEARGRARLELALLRLEPPLGELARRSRALHALLVRLHLACGDTNLGDDLQFLIAKARLRLASFPTGCAPGWPRRCWCRSDS